MTLSISNFVKGVFFFSEEIRRVEEKVTCIFNVAAISTNGFNVSWKLFLNLCSWRLLSPSRNFVRYSIRFRLWQLYMLFVVGVRKCKIFLWIISTLGAFWISGSSLFHLMMTGGKDALFEKLCSTLNWGILFAYLVE